MSAFQPVEALAHGVPLAVVYVTLTLIPELTLTLDELALILMTAAVVTTNVSPPPISLLSLERRPRNRIRCTGCRLRRIRSPPHSKG